VIAVEEVAGHPVGRRAPAFDTTRSGGQCPQPLQRNTSAAGDAVPIRAVGDPTQRLIDLPETSLGPLDKQHLCHDIGISRWALIVEEIADIAAAQRPGCLTA
jgi:hypothetical protein